MARRDVIEVTCDRCGRTETQSSTELPELEGPEVELTFHGEKVLYADLCKRCRRSVEGYVARIIKKDTDESSESAEPKPEEKKKGFLGMGS